MKNKYKRNQREPTKGYYTSDKKPLSSWKKAGLVWLMAGAMLVGSATKIWADYKSKDLQLESAIPNAIYYDEKTNENSGDISEKAGCIVEKGDTLGEIAKENGLSLEQLLSYNPEIKKDKKKGYKIIVGEQIYLTPKKIDLPTSYNTKDFTKDSDKILFARMIFGEGKTCSYDEKAWIAFSALNRVYDNVAWNGETLREVILKPQQYSCFNKSDPNYDRIKNPEKYNLPEFEESLEIADQALKAYPMIQKGELEDPTQGATYYHTKEINPYWKKDMKNPTTKPEFKHIFYSPKK
jgi:N-acetylmuramoyl-L-alanine amidase